MRFKLNNSKSRNLKVKSFGIAAILAFTFSFTNLSAQESIIATGGNASGSGGSASYSVGQMMYQTHTGSSGSVAEGVQQPYEISVETGIEQAEGIDLSVTVYPNPATEDLILNFKEDMKKRHDLSIMSYRLYDMQGLLLQSGKIKADHTRIAMSDLVPSTYFVKVILRNKVVKTFKIVKK